MTGATEKLTQIAEARAERSRLEAQLQAATVTCSQADQRVTEARARLGSEQEDVDQLESMSLTRILAALRDRLDQDLDRERAELAAAQYAVAEADARAAVEHQQVEAITQRRQCFVEQTRLEVGEQLLKAQQALQFLGGEPEAG